VRLSPLNVLIRPPDYSGFLTTDTRASPRKDGIRAVRSDVQPVYPPGLAGPGNPILGARIELDFSIRSIDPNGSYLFTLFEQEDSLIPVSMDFAKYR
jgi:hypothetical protein